MNISNGISCSTRKRSIFSPSNLACQKLATAHLFFQFFPGWHKREGRVRSSLGRRGPERKKEREPVRNCSLVSSSVQCSSGLQQPFLPPLFPGHRGQQIALDTERKGRAEESRERARANKGPEIVQSGRRQDERHLRRVSERACIRFIHSSKALLLHAGGRIELPKGTFGTNIQGKKKFFFPVTLGRGRL